MDLVQIIHDDTDRITTVPRRQVNVLAQAGWRLLSDVPDELVEVEPSHIGGGWYELPDGSHVQGRDAAEAALGD